MGNQGRKNTKGKGGKSGALELEEKRGKQGALERGEGERRKSSAREQRLKGEIRACENTKRKETLVRRNTKGKEENRAHENTDLKKEINSGAREQERRNSGATFLFTLRTIPTDCCATN